MLNKQAQRILNGPRKPEPGKLIVLSGGFERRHKANGHSRLADRTMPVITQLQLARIKERQSKIAYEQDQLSTQWEEVRTNLMRGGTIEEGPIRAWLERRFVVVKGKKRKTRTRLRVY